MRLEKPFAVNQNANAIRWGTLYNLRSADQPPQPANTTVGFFKTGSCRVGHNADTYSYGNGHVERDTKTDPLTKSSSHTRATSLALHLAGPPEK